MTTDLLNVGIGGRGDVLVKGSKYLYIGRQEIWLSKLSSPSNKQLKETHTNTSRPQNGRGKKVLHLNVSCLSQGLRFLPARSSPARASSLLTLHVIVGFATGHPFAPLEAPVVGVRQHHLYEHIVVGSGIESVYVEAQERKHAPVQGNRTRKIDLNWDVLEQAQAPAGSPRHLG